MEREVERLEWERNNDEISWSKRLQRTSLSSLKYGISSAIISCQWPKEPRFGIESRPKFVKEEREDSHFASLTIRSKLSTSLRVCKIGRFPTWKGIALESEGNPRSIKI